MSETQVSNQLWPPKSHIESLKGVGGGGYRQVVEIKDDTLVLVTSSSHLNFETYHCPNTTKRLQVLI